MKRTVKIITKIVLIIIGIVLMLIAGLKIWHEFNNPKDLNEIQGSYGKTITLTQGERINLCSYGQGDKILVILPGLGSSAPGLEFKGLANKLNDYKVVVVEPLGYGLSDLTAKERTANNICNEIHEALQSEGYTKYCLAAHSVSGLYAMTYINNYPDEVEQYIGIDSSIPSQLKYDSEDPTSAISFNHVLTQLGIMRAMGMLSSDEDVLMTGMTDYLNESEIMLYRKIFYTRSANNTVVNEAKLLHNNMQINEDFEFPQNCPVHFYLSQENCDKDDYWLDEHEKYIKNNADSSCNVLDGGHYLHLTSTDQLAECIKSVLTK